MEYLVSYETDAGEHIVRRYRVLGLAEHFARKTSREGFTVYVVQECGPVQTGQRVFSAGRAIETQGVYAA